MPPVNIELNCLKCQQSKALLTNVDVTSMSPWEQYEQLQPQIEKLHWSVRRHWHPNIKRYLVCPPCMNLESRKLAAMKPFSPKSKCPQCAYSRVSTRYMLGTEELATLPISYMRRECERCTYSWEEGCLVPRGDSPGEPSGTRAEQVNIPINPQAIFTEKLQDLCKT